MGYFLFFAILPVVFSFTNQLVYGDLDKCYLTGGKNVAAEEELLNRISPLFGQRFRTDNNGSSFVVAICADTTDKEANVSVTQGQIHDSRIVLGRRNDTSISGGAFWVKISYGSGDKYTNGSLCLAARSASIYIFCSMHESDDKPNLMLAGIDSCSYNFVLQSSSVCSHNQELSGFSMFFIIVFIALIVYFVTGILYRRLVLNAQHCQQLPHFTFWSKLGSMLADGCNYMCRCESDNQESWNNITSNFDSADRDDVLLRS